MTPAPMHAKWASASLAIAQAPIDAAEACMRHIESHWPQYGFCADKFAKKGNVCCWIATKATSDHT